ncbi:MAG: hypothetical protein OHK0013_00260 [Sandaracinaceae bacterium]
MNRSLLAATVALLALAAPSLASAQADVYVDETMTFYAAEHQRTAQEGSRTFTTYDFGGQVRVFSADAEFPRDSVLRWELRQGDRRLAGVRCRTFRSGFNAPAAGAPQQVLAAWNCRDATVLRETGELTVVWFYINGATDEEREIARHTVHVRELPVFSRGVPPTAGAPHLVVDRHGEILSSFVIEDPFVGGVGFEGYFERFSPRSGDESHLMLVFNASPQDDVSADSTTVRCRLDGQPVEIPNNRVVRAEAIETIQNAWLPVPGATSVADSTREEYVRFYRYAVLLPLTIDVPGGRVAADRMALRAGQWECDLRTREAVTYRTFRFAVGADGRVLPHAEETEGGLRLGPGIHFVETVIPASEHPFDFRTDPSALARAFHGRGFRSAAGRALTVPPIGEPLPVAPRAAGRGGASAGRGGRGGRSR